MTYAVNPFSGNPMGASKLPKAVARFMAEFEWSEAYVRQYVRDQAEFFSQLVAPGTSTVEGWLALKMGCTRQQAGTVLRWAGIKADSSPAPYAFPPGF